MMMGTTLAWFVDRVENTNNRIEAGNLEVDLVMLKNGEYVSIAETDGKSTDLFSIAKGSTVLWGPGKTETLYLGIRNKGSLALSYTASLEINKNVFTVDSEILGQNLLYAIVPLENEDDKVSSWKEALDSAVNKGTLSESSIGVGVGVLDAIAEDTESKDETDFYAVVVHMRETPPVACMGKSVKINIKVSATQLTTEQQEERERENLMLHGNEEAELPETLSATSWKMKAEVADFAFLEAEDGKESPCIFPEETGISDGEVTYPMSMFSVITRGETMLLAAMPIENTETEDNSDAAEKAEAAAESIFVYFPKQTVEENEEDSSGDKAERKTEDDNSGWYLIDYEAFQKLVSDEKTEITGIFTSENKITDEKKLPTVTFPEAEDDVLKNADLIKWFASSAKLQAD